ncbi:MAG: hypothetical protein U1D30_06850 [Planctomycetota bacterium]
MRILVYALRSRGGGLADQAARTDSTVRTLSGVYLIDFLGGTDHTQRHTQTVEKIARMVLSDEFLATLTSHELFLLAVACHYHDLAMAGTEADDRTAEDREQVRRDHAVRIGEIVRHRWAELGFENSRSAEVLGEVCRGHRPRKNADGEANWDELREIEVLGPGVAVRVRLLSALIYAIDELHLGADRAPERVQNWRNIQDDESRRHWRRHQAVNGPVTQTPSALLFQVTADTPEFEENLRSQVFRKAFSAMRDLRRQAELEGITAALPSITIQWQRERMWELLFPVVCSDMAPRSRSEIIQAVLGRFRQHAAERIALDSVCTESGNAEAELEASIGRAVDDAVTKRHLVTAPQPAAGFVLSLLTTVADVYFARARQADNLDLLFVGRYRDSWEQELFASEFGRGYVRSSVFPAVERSYSVRLTQRPPTDPVRLLLESCPTAARLVSDNSPLADNLVKESLLAQVVMTGALLDLHSDPERLLDGPVRAAVRALTTENGTVAPTVRLLEELALVGGFTHEQLSTAACPSEAAQAAIEDQKFGTGNSLQIHISQTIPAGAGRATHLSRLLLASQRAGTPILLTAAEGHELTLQVEGNDELANRDTAGVLVEIGPSVVHPPATIRLPARIEISRPTSTIRLRLGRFSDNAPTAYPVVVTLPAPSASGQRSRITLESSTHWPELTVRDWRALESANQIIRKGGARIELIMEEGNRQLAVMENPQGSLLFKLWPGPEVIQRALRGLDGELPAPVRTSPAIVAEIANMSQVDRCARWKAERNYDSDPRRRVSSIYLRLTTANGHPFEERFLRFLPFDFFPAPTFRTDISDDVKRQWNEGENDFQLVCFFYADIYELAKELCTWCANPDGEFPLRIQSGGTAEPVTRSVMTVRLLRRRDRPFYCDRPIIFEFRPVNRREAYEMEAGYWRTKGDQERAQLAQEICDREPSAGSAVGP